MFGKKYLNKTLVFSFALTVLGPFSAMPSYADKLVQPEELSGLIGSWRGRGQAIASPGGKPQAVSCKARYTWVTKPNDRLQGIVTCAAASEKANISLYVGQDPENKSFGGTYIQKWGSSDVQEFGKVRGKNIGPQTYNFAISAFGKVRANLNLKLDSQNQHTVSVAGDGEDGEEQAFSVVFKR